MKKSKLFCFIALTITFVVILLLVTGAPVLLIALNDANTIPLGTFITWAGMIALPLSMYWGIKELRKPSNKPNRILSILLKIIIALAFLWVPISYGLAGNFSFTFTEKATFQGGQIAMKWFWYLCYGIGIGSVVIPLRYWFLVVIAKLKKASH